MSNLMKIHPVGTELILAGDSRTDERDEADSRSSQFWESAQILSPCWQHIHFKIWWCIGDYVKQKFEVAAAAAAAGTCVFQLG